MSLAPVCATWIRSLAMGSVAEFNVNVTAADGGDALVLMLAESSSTEVLPITITTSVVPAAAGPAAATPSKPAAAHATAASAEA